MGQREPRGLIRSDAGADDTALMPSDGVECQGRARLIRVDDFAIGNQAEFDKCLEAVADSADQAVALFKKFGDPFPDFCISEEGSDKLSGAVRFVSSGETAGNEDHLA